MVERGVKLFMVNKARRQIERQVIAASINRRAVRDRIVGRGALI